MNKFTLKVNYPHVQKKDSSNKYKQIRKKRRLPIIALGLKVDKNTGQKEYIAVFEPPKDALRTHVERIQKTIFFDINVIYSGLATSINKDFKIPPDSKFRKLDINLAGFNHFILFKENINSIRSPSRGVKYEICGNEKCNETHKVIYKPNNSNSYICENCYKAEKNTSVNIENQECIGKEKITKKPDKQKNTRKRNSEKQNKLKIAA